MDGLLGKFVGHDDAMPYFPVSQATTTSKLKYAVNLRKGRYGRNPDWTSLRAGSRDCIMCVLIVCHVSLQTRCDLGVPVNVGSRKYT